VLGELDAHMRRHILDPPLRGPGISYQQAVAMREFVVDLAHDQPAPRFHL
jgi:hypothetical protein